MGIYVRHLNLDNYGIYCNIKELYPIVGGEAPMYILTENPVDPSQLFLQ